MSCETYSEMPSVKLELHEKVQNQTKKLNSYRQTNAPNVVESWYDCHDGKVKLNFFYRQVCKEFLPKTKKADESKKKRLEISSNNQLEKSIKIEFRHLVRLQNHLIQCFKINKYNITS